MLIVKYFMFECCKRESLLCKLTAIVVRIFEHNLKIKNHENCHKKYNSHKSEK